MNDDQILTPTESEITEATESTEVAEGAETPEVEAPKAKVARVRGKRYVEARSMVDRTREYQPAEAIELVKRTSLSSFEGTVVAHFNLKREIKPVDVAMPFSTGKSIRVGIVNDELIEQFKAGVADFDVLLTTPAMMGKLVPFARLLGPKGLMPNPKNGTVTSDPEAKKKDLEAGSVSIKSEKKAPLLHTRLGKTGQPTEELVANLDAIIKAVKPINIARLTIAPTMGPGVRVVVAATV